MPKKKCQCGVITARVANNVEEACKLVEAGFEYITGDYHNGGKIFRKRK